MYTLNLVKSHKFDVLPEYFDCKSKFKFKFRKKIMEIKRQLIGNIKDGMICMDLSHLLHPENILLSTFAEAFVKQSINPGNLTIF